MGLFLPRPATAGSSPSAPWRRLLPVLAGVCATACAVAVVRPPRAAQRTGGSALLVLPGFGYNRAGEHVLRSLAPAMAADGVTLFVPSYISRAGLRQSRANLEQFIDAERLDTFEHLYVFAFIAGAWTFNPLEMDRRLSNLEAVVYDRSPYQERGPAIARDRLHFLAWLRYGSVVFDVANEPYPPLHATGIALGVLVETKPTSFIQKHAEAARSYGPFQFGCEAFVQSHNDCAYLNMSHDEMYLRFSEVWPEVRAFIRTGRFTAGAERTPPAGNRLDDGRKR